MFSFPIVIKFISFYKAHIEHNREETFRFSSCNIFPVWGVMSFGISVSPSTKILYKTCLNIQ